VSRLALGVASAVAALVVGACSSRDDVDGSYSVAFQSTPEAVAAPDMRVFVFDVSALSSTEPCLDLLYLRESGQDLPPTLLELGPMSTCDVAGGAGRLSLPLAQLAILVVAETASSDFARGCAVHTFSASDPNVTVVLALAPGQSVPATSCTSLSEHCSGGC
jgi:hypothetical protein